MIRIAIAEDQAAERAKLLRYLNRYQEENGCQFEIEMYENGAEIVSAYHPGMDILFLDIEMPVLDGMRTAKILREKDGQLMIVFVTNLAQYAVDSYDVEAMDFIVKPLKWGSFTFRMNRILSRYEKRRREEAHSFVLKDESGDVRRITVPGLLYVEVNGHTLTYHTEQGVFSARGTMQEVEKNLLPHGFCRCSQSYMVNLRFVTAVDDEMVSVGNERLPVSRAKRRNLIKALSEFVVAS